MSVNMYGLYFERYTDGFEMDETDPEKYTTLPKMIRTSITDTNSIFIGRRNYHLKKRKEMKIKNGKEDSTLVSDPTNEEKAMNYIIKKLDECDEQMEKLNKEFNILFKSLATYSKKSGETHFTTIENFCPKYRGYFLTILHMLLDFRNDLDATKKYGLMKEINVIQFVLTRLEKIGFITSLVNILEKVYTRIHGDQKYDFYLAGYNKELDIENIDFDFVPFYERIGKQYDKGSRFFHNSFQAMMAGYFHISNSNFWTSSLMTRNIGFATHGLYYLTKPYKRAKMNFEFGRSEIFKTDGTFYWNMLDDPFVAPMLDFFVLKKVKMSKTFTLPYTQLKYNDSGLQVILPSLKKTKKKVSQIKDSEVKKIVNKNEKNNIEMMNSEEIKLVEKKKNDDKKNLKTHKKWPSRVIDSDDSDMEIEIIENDPKSLEGEKFKQKGKAINKVRRRNGGVDIDTMRMFYKQLTEIEVKEKSSVKVRLIIPRSNVKGLNSKIPNVMFKTDRPFVNFWKKLFSCKSSCCEKTDFSKMIFHIHGGGFVAMSSHSHETYTRLWSKGVNVPLFSVDYTNAPDERYPTQVLQCWKAYKFVIENYEKIFGQKLEQFILAGDSAGGNLAIVTTLLALIEGVRLPDALMINYPTTVTAYECCPSRICALLDPLVSRPFLELVLYQYPDEKFTDVEKSTNPFLTPLVIPDEMLAKFPPAYMTACCLDPLFDDGVSFAKKLNRLNGGKVLLRIMEGVPHGYLNFNDIVKKGREEIDREVKWMNEFFERNEENLKNEELEKGK